MGFLSKRFSFHSQSGQFHSSGMTDGDSVTGGTSAQSFEQRKSIENNRQSVGKYSDSMVSTDYRKDAINSDDYREAKQARQEGMLKIPHGYASSSRVDDRPPDSQVNALARSSRIDDRPSANQINGTARSSRVDDRDPEKTLGYARTSRLDNRPADQQGGYFNASSRIDGRSTKRYQQRLARFHADKNLKNQKTARMSMTRQGFNAGEEPRDLGGINPRSNTRPSTMRPQTRPGFYREPPSRGYDPYR
jgi:hypothetical protein